MRQMFSVYRNDIIDQEDSSKIESIPMIFNHGCITDAAHKFFSTGKGKLLVTYCYFEVLHRWQSIFISWIGHQTAKTYECHFFQLFQSIGNALKINDEISSLLSIFQKIIGSMVDFSDA